MFFQGWFSQFSYGKLRLISLCIFLIIVMFCRFLPFFDGLFRRMQPLITVNFLPTSVVYDEFYIQQSMVASRNKLLRKWKRSSDFYKGVLSSEETLSLLARRSGLQLGTLLSVNKVRDLWHVRPGMRYILPATDGILHRVRLRQTLETISGYYGISVQRLIEANKLLVPEIREGQELFIPNCFLSHDQVRRIVGRSFIFPVPGRLKRLYGEVRNELTDTFFFNDGIDIVTLPDQDVYAAADGKIVSSGLHSLYGYYVILEHNKFLHTFYGYLDGIKHEIGQEIQEGEIIGNVGSSGYTNGQWLHFTVFYKNKPVDPFKYLR